MNNADSFPLSSVQKKFLIKLRARLWNGLYFTSQIAEIRTKMLNPKEDEKNWVFEQKVLLKARLKEQIFKLQVGQGFVFYGGYHGHGILFEIEKRLDDKLLFRMINTGEGAEDDKISKVYIIDLNFPDQLLEIILNLENNFKTAWAISNALKLTASSSPLSGLLYTLSFNENFDFKTQKHGSCSILPLWAWLYVHIVYGASGEGSSLKMFQRLRRAFIQDRKVDLDGFAILDPNCADILRQQASDLCSQLEIIEES